VRQTKHTLNHVHTPRDFNWFAYYSRRHIYEMQKRALACYKKDQTLHGGIRRHTALIKTATCFSTKDSWDPLWSDRSMIPYYSALQSVHMFDISKRSPRISIRFCRGSLRWKLSGELHFTSHRTSKMPVCEKLKSNYKILFGHDVYLTEYNENSDVYVCTVASVSVCVCAIMYHQNQ
jgi:hypothetical protein